MDLLIVPRVNSYSVADFVKYNEADTIVGLGLFHVVDEDGTLKIRYAEGWSPMGWYRLSDDLPYRPVATEG